MEIAHTAHFDTPVGTMFAASTERGLAYLELPRASGRGFAGWLRVRGGEFKVVEALAPNRAVVSQILAYLGGERSRFDLPLDVRGTPFQRRVWGELLRIPYGQTRSYADVARAVGLPRASRAVGAANGANPLPLVIPCHRVVASGGKLGGYGGGLTLKRQLLAMERSCFADDRLL